MSGINPRAIAGSNHPPSQMATSQLVYEEINSFLKGIPVIETPKQQKYAAELIKRGRIALSELDEERDGKVRPLNEEVGVINRSYKVVSEPLSRIVRAVKDRLADAIRAEEIHRIAAAELRYQEMMAAKEALRLAQLAEREATENAAQGEVVDIGASIHDTALAHAQAEKAMRAAAIAEKDATVRVATGFGKAISMRTFEVLVAYDVLLAVTEMPDNQKIINAVLSAARDYRKDHGKLPAGVRVETERKL